MTADNQPSVKSQRCTVTGCRASAVGTLIYEAGKRRRQTYRRFEHPLCEKHSDPKFHLRPLTQPLKPTNWRWEPVDA